LLATALLSAATSGPWRVVAGTYLGIGLLYGASIAASLVTLVIPTVYVALLGVVPLALGVAQLLDRGDSAAHAASGQGQGVFGVAAINVAAGADNIGVYTPLFATSTAHTIAVYGVVFAILTGALCWVAGRLVTHPALVTPVRRYGPRLVPWVLIALGTWILLTGLAALRD
jgi:cadmium resistance protein CadD (predicted permease)